MTSPALSVQQLTLHTDHKVLFEGINFSLAHGEILAVMGPSGIGKSMLAKAIAGFLPETLQSRGQIWLNHTEVSQLSLIQRPAAARPAVVFQDALKALNPLATLEQQLALIYSQRRTTLSAKDKQVIDPLLQQLGFAEPAQIYPRFASQLSGGQRQRICIALALLSQASLVIADEPTSALDPVTERDILQLLQQHLKRNHKAGILITHDLHAALACDQLLVLADGKQVAFGQPMQVLRDSNHAFCQQLAALTPAFFAANLTRLQG